MVPIIRFMDWWEPVNRQMERFSVIAWALLVFTMGTTLLMLMDRTPPFAVLKVYPAEARPGEHVWLRADVRRDLDRKCSVEFSRYIFDSTGGRVADLGNGSMSAASIEAMDQRAPGKLAVRITVPEGTTPGVARLSTDLSYICNRTHLIWPIHTTSTMQFTVLP